ncbi:MAG: WxL domain-containing protein [Chloroflexi bacterium]|nr:WxL domain-containing protein [Chloroflexota bacterium]
MGTIGSIQRLLRVMLPLAALALVATVVSNGGGINSASAATTTVTVGQTNGGGATGVNQFNAAAITISAGDTTQWNSALDNRSHDVTSYAETVPGTPDWQSPTLRSGTANTTFSRVFSTAGTYTYYCSLHASQSDAAPGVIDANIASGMMVGKITVNAPAPDTTAPAASAVAASPNPTDGASSVALTATIADSGTPLGTIASAQYRVDGGSPVAMSAVDGTFNGSSENVTANVPVGALSLGNHVIEVRGTDLAGNIGAYVALSGGLNVTAPPAGAVQATINVQGGALTNTAQNIAFPAVALSGADQTVLAAAAAWQAKDARGTGDGWNVTIASTNFTGAGTIGVANFKCKQDQADIVTVSGNTAPNSMVTTFQSLSGTPLKLLQATGGAGMGTYDYTPDFQLTVPASTAAGSYTANVTVSINSGP